MPNPEIDEFGDKFWVVNGEYHRLDGPAVERISGTKFWYVNGLLHRLDGPAIEWTDGSKDWYANDKIVNGPLNLLKHGANWKDLVEYLTPREIAQTKLDK